VRAGQLHDRLTRPSTGRQISSTSGKSFEDAVNVGINRATKTLRGVSGAWIKEQKVAVKNGKITSYQVNMMVSFVLED
jgi:dodecin